MSRERQSEIHERNRGIYLGIVTMFYLMDIASGLLQILYSSFLLYTNYAAAIFPVLPYVLLCSGILAFISLAFGLLYQFTTNMVFAVIRIVLITLFIGMEPILGTQLISPLRHTTIGAVIISLGILRFVTLILGITQSSWSCYKTNNIDALRTVVAKIKAT
ncbi:unnamed protein product [Rodentolepis nana]|uniref:Polysaccharide biosynthesis protein n=1 Tax=Rodentolepis nana TaxID=102285 RepID=A0A0R3TWH6_RODNA|nr:unnamed protein product [Rodentolepis nana]